MKTIPRVLLTVFVTCFFIYIINGDEGNLNRIRNVINPINENPPNIPEFLGNNIINGYLIIKMIFLIILIILLFKYSKKFRNTKKRRKDMKEYSVIKNLKIKYIRFPGESVQFSVYDGNIEYVSDKIPIKQISRNSNGINNFSVGKMMTYKCELTYNKKMK